MLHDAFRPIGLSGHWLRRQTALWLGLATGRAVFVKRCLKPTGGGAPVRKTRMPSCDSAYFDLNEFVRLRHGGSFAMRPDVLAALEASRVPPCANHTELFAPAFAREPLVSMHVFWNNNQVKDLLRELQRYARTAAQLHVRTELLTSCFSRCSGFALSRPDESLTPQLAPLVPRLARAAVRIGLHVRTMAVDKPVCFPADTPPTRSAIDAAFGNNVCMRKAFDNWRFKLKPAKTFRKRSGPMGTALCPAVHLADRLPLSAWFTCAVTLARTRPAAKWLYRSSAGSSGARAAAAGSDGSTAVFFTTDAEALHRYAVTADPLADDAFGGGTNSSMRRARLYTLPGSTEVGHNDLTYDGRTAFEHRRRVFARGAADWFLLSLMDIILQPVQSGFSLSACIPFAAPGECAVISPRLERLSATGGLHCGLEQCFPGRFHCKGCAWVGEYMHAPYFRTMNASASGG